MVTTHSVDADTCKKCHICAAICPAGIIRAEDPVRFNPERQPLCIRCGQCMAVCPTRSIIVEGLSYDKDFFELPERQDVWQDAFYGLIGSRRSIADRMRSIAAGISFRR